MNGDGHLWAGAVFVLSELRFCFGSWWENTKAIFSFTVFPGEGIHLCKPDRVLEFSFLYLHCLVFTPFKISHHLTEGQNLEMGSFCCFLSCFSCSVLTFILNTNKVSNNVCDVIKSHILLFKPSVCEGQPIRRKKVKGGRSCEESWKEIWDDAPHQTANEHLKQGKQWADHGELPVLAVWRQS